MNTKDKLKEFLERLGLYTEHTMKEHSLETQLIVQNITSDFLNEFEVILNESKL